MEEKNLTETMENTANETTSEPIFSDCESVKKTEKFPITKRDLIFAFLFLVGISVFFQTLPRISQTKCKHFLELEISVIVFRQGHTIVKACMQEELGGQITVQLEVERIFPVGYHLIICRKVFQFGNP